MYLFNFLRWNPDWLELRILPSSVGIGITGVHYTLVFEFGFSPKPAIHITVSPISHFITRGTVNKNKGCVCCAASALVVFEGCAFNICLCSASLCVQYMERPCPTVFALRTFTVDKCKPQSFVYHVLAF